MAEREQHLMRSACTAWDHRSRVFGWPWLPSSIYSLGQFSRAELPTESKSRVSAHGRRPEIPDKTTSSLGLGQSGLFFSIAALLLPLSERINTVIAVRWCGCVWLDHLSSQVRSHRPAYTACNCRSVVSLLGYAFVAWAS